MILDGRIEDGFWVATSTKFGAFGMALLSRSYPEHGDLLLVFGGKADVEEYFVSWGFNRESYMPREISSISEIERIAIAAEQSGLDGFVVNPPLDERDPEDVFTPEEMRQWAREKENL